MGYLFQCFRLNFFNSGAMGITECECLSLVFSLIMVKAHEGSIRGVAVDGLNQFTITAGSEGLVKFWKFKTRELVHSTNLSVSPSKMLLHRDR